MTNQLIYVFCIVDCGIPRAPMNSTIINYSGTKVGDIVTFECDEGYRPSAKINGTCQMDSMWDPSPEIYNCTLIYGKYELKKCIYTK